MGNISQVEKEISFNDLSKYSGWPKRLLSLEPFLIKKKTEQEVLREFQVEKWNQLFQAVSNADHVTLEMVEAAHVDLDAIGPYYKNGKFALATNQTVLNYHLDLYHKILEPHINGASALVELGAGYGSKILGLGQRESFSGIPLVGVEFTENGRDLMELLSKRTNRSMKIGFCDFRSLKIDEDIVPENAVIFTSYAAHYVPELSMEFTDFLLKLKPKMIVHFEPVYELFSSDSIHELMCRRYMEINDYTTNLMSVINNSVNDGKSIVSSVTINTLSGNPFLPISIIEWHPVNS